MDDNKNNITLDEPILTIEQPTGDPIVTIPEEAAAEGEKPQQEEEKAPKEDTETTPSLREEIERRAGEESPINTRTATLRSILAGDILTSGAVKRQVWLVLLITLTFVIYITFRYKSEMNMLKIDKLRNELQDVRFKVTAVQSKMTEMTRQSKVLEALKQNNDSTLKSTSQHPYIIIVPGKKK